VDGSLARVMGLLDLRVLGNDEEAEEGGGRCGRWDEMGVCRQKGGGLSS